MTEAGADRERWIGRTIDGRYRVLGLLGDGGMGSVYEAEHVALGKRVALKVIHPELVLDEEALARFEREARATAAVEHPHVAAAMDFGRLEGGGAYLIVQLVHGLSLRRRLEAGPVAWREACAIGARIADALTAIHARGFVHRDLTADNVLLTTDENGAPFVRVLDLGVAGVVSPAPGERLTEEGHVVGTPGYMPPEQALGRPTDPRADLYALGVLMWEMCSGRSLWGERALTQIVASQLTEDAPPIPQLSSATAPAELAQLIARLLSRAPADRPADAASVRDALRRFATMSSVVPVLARFRRAGRCGDRRRRGLDHGAGARDRARLRAGRRRARGPREVRACRFGPGGPGERRGSRARGGELACHRAGRSAAQWPLARRSTRGGLELAELPDAPPWARAASALELARSCAERRDALERLALIASPEALPVIARMRDAPRTGCGRGGRSDCYQCVRAEIERAHRASGGEP
ncbi:MAG: serine/threonine protein kinase [Sandaracinaceae bacterium]|nr:serine/threonine protein kinase [Sandaracinaceae bacterium]